jgi:hypothetical protein
MGKKTERFRFSAELRIKNGDMCEWHNNEMRPFDAKARANAHEPIRRSALQFGGKHPRRSFCLFLQINQLHWAIVAQGW